MVFWAAILVGALFVWMGIRLGFFQTWSLLFSIAIAIYLAVFLAPAVAECAPTSGAMSPYTLALSMAVIAGGCFALLYGASYVFLTAQFRVVFPAVFDILLAGGLGFLTGFLAFSFVALVLTISPVAENDLVAGVGLNPESQKTNIACIAWCCAKVHSVASSDAPEDAAQAAIDQLIEAAQGTRADEPDVNEPPLPQEPQAALLGP